MPSNTTCCRGADPPENRSGGTEKSTSRSNKRSGRLAMEFKELKQLALLKRRLNSLAVRRSSSSPDPLSLHLQVQHCTGADAGIGGGTTNTAKKVPTTNGVTTRTLLTYVQSEQIERLQYSPSIKNSTTHVTVPLQMMPRYYGRSHTRLSRRNSLARKSTTMTYRPRKFYEGFHVVFVSLRRMSRCALPAIVPWNAVSSEFSS